MTYARELAEIGSAITIDSSKNVGIGTSNPSVKLVVNGSSGMLVQNSADASNPRLLFTPVSGGPQVIAGYGDGDSNEQQLAFATGVTATERMRILSDGWITINKISAVASGDGLIISPSASIIASIPSGNTYHVYSTASASYRFYVSENGGVYNYSGNNVNLSDERTKKNIEVAGSYLNKICAIPVKLFNYKDEAEGEQRTLGVIAQDVEAVAPEFVNNDGWKGDEQKDGIPLKTIYSTDMMFGLMKAIQEQQVMIEELKAKVAALEAA